jgi:preprotein translocase subunit SecB
MSDNQTGTGTDATGQGGAGAGGVGAGSAGAAGEGQAQSTLTVHTQYIRDLSFENPNAPQVYAQMKSSPQVDLRIELPIRRVQERLFELGVKLTLNAKVENQVAFIVELDYAGLMSVGNHVPDGEIEPLLAIEGASLLYPFARRIVADTVRDGGFPPVMIGSIDFARLYRQRRQQGAEGTDQPAAAPAPAGAPSGEGTA